MADIDRLKNIKDTIECMNKCYQLEILKIFQTETSIILSENNNGIFINLTDIDIKIVNKIEEYIGYVKEQQLQLSSIEDEKADIKKEFFNQTQKNVKIKRNKQKLEEVKGETT